MPFFGGSKLTQGAVLGAVALEAVALVGAVHVAVLTRRRIGWRAFGLSRSTDIGPWARS